MVRTPTHTCTPPKRRIAAGIVVCMTLSLLLRDVAFPAVATAASSWKPTLLVNTEAFQVIDDDDTTADIVMRFGDTINKSLTYERAAGQFKFDDDLEVVGTVSGTTVFATNSLRSSGSLVFEGAASGSSLYLGTSLKGAGLSDCDTAETSKLLWDTTTGRFSCGTDGGGSLVDHYVNAGGDTMTGALRIDVTGGNFSTLGLRVANTASGAHVHAEKTLSSSGALVVEGDLTFGDAIGDAVTVNAGTWTFANDTNFVLSGGVNGLSFDTSTLSIDALNDRVGIGTTAPTSPLAITNGATPYAADETILLDIKRNASNGNDTTSAAGIRLGNNSNVFALLYGGTTDRLRVLDGGLVERLTILNGGNVGISKSAPSTKLDVVGTISGATVLTRNLLNSTSATTGSVLVSRTAGTAEWKDPSGAMTWYIDGDIATGTSQSATVIMPFGMTLTDVDLAIKTAPTGQSLIVDINEDGSTLFSTRPEIDASAVREDGNHAFSDTSLAAGSSITIDIDQVGSGTAGNGLTIMLKGTRKY